MLSQPRARLQVWHHQASLHSKVEQPEARPSQRRQWRHPSRPARCFLEDARSTRRQGPWLRRAIVGQRGCGHIVPIQWCCVDPNGPRIQWVHCSGTWTYSHAGHHNSTNGGAASSPIHAPIKRILMFTMDSDEEGFAQASKDGWLLPGKTDEHVYKHKHLKSIQITKAPNDPTSCRESRAACLAAVIAGWT